MKVFVTGADGLLGTNVVHELLRQGYLVKALIHPSSRSNSINELDIEKIAGDILKPDSFSSELEDCACIIHIAASTQIWPSNNQIVNKVNIEGTKNMMKLSQENDIRRFIYISSANSFAPGKAENPGTEESPFKQGRYKNNYISSKYQCQEMLLKAHASNDFPAIIIAPTFLIGPYDFGPSSGQLLINLAKRNVPFFSKGVKNYVHVKDVAMAIVNAIKKGRIGECYIAGGESMDYETFFRLFYKTMEMPFKMKRMPSPIVLFAGIMGSIIARITGKPPKISYGVVKMSFTNQYYSPAKAIRELDMPQTPIKTAIKDAMDWFKQHNYY